jgi:serine/threonine protein kinase
MENSLSQLSFSDRFFSTASSDLCHTEAVPHDDFLAFLAACQAFEIDLLPITWQTDLGELGLGGESRISQSQVNIQSSYAYKRVRSDMPTEGQASFKTLLTEISILGNGSIRRHPNIAKLHGVCFENGGEDVAPILPVLVFEKSVHGDLARFMKSPAGAGLSFSQRQVICGHVLAGISALHSFGK